MNLERPSLAAPSLTDSEGFKRPTAANAKSVNTPGKIFNLETILKILAAQYFECKKSVTIYLPKKRKRKHYVYSQDPPIYVLKSNHKNLF
jgi:hypothetical protein